MSFLDNQVINSEKHSKTFFPWKIIF